MLARGGGSGPGLDALRRCASTGLDPDLQGKLAEGVRAGESKGGNGEERKKQQRTPDRAGQGKEKPKEKRNKTQGERRGTEHLMANHSLCCALP